MSSCKCTPDTCIGQSLTQSMTGVSELDCKFTTKTWFLRPTLKKIKKKNYSKSRNMFPQSIFK